MRGERIQRSLDTKSPTEARLRFQEMERQVYTGEPHLLAAWSAVRDEFLAVAGQSVRPSTLVKMNFVLTRFSKFLASRQIKSLASITTPVIAAYCTERRTDLHPTRRTAVSAEGVKADLRILHRVFAYAVERKYAKQNPVTQRRTPEPGRVTQPFSDDELARMLAAARSKPKHGVAYPLEPVLLTFIHTGFRISDVVGLERREVDLDAGLILRRTHKRGRIVAIPIHPELAAALKSHFVILSGAKNLQSSPYVFSTASGRPLTALDEYLARLWRRAGIPNAHPHRFRDTFSVRLLRRGASLYDVAMLLGITVATAEKHYAPYVRALQERGRELVESIPAASTIGLHPTPGSA